MISTGPWPCVCQPQAAAGMALATHLRNAQGVCPLLHTNPVMLQQRIGAGALMWVFGQAGLHCTTSTLHCRLTNQAEASNAPPPGFIKLLQTSWNPNSLFERRSPNNGACSLQRPHHAASLYSSCQVSRRRAPAAAVACMEGVRATNWVCQDSELSKQGMDLQKGATLLGELLRPALHLAPHDQGPGQLLVLRFKRGCTCKAAGPLHCPPLLSALLLGILTHTDGNRCYPP